MYSNYDKRQQQIELEEKKAVFKLAAIIYLIMILVGIAIHVIGFMTFKNLVVWCTVCGITIMIMGLFKTLKYIHG